MAVPKDRTSKRKRNTRLSKWKAKGRQAANRALSTAKSIINQNSNFVLDPKNKINKVKNQSDSNVNELFQDNNDMENSEKL